MDDLEQADAVDASDAIDPERFADPIDLLPAETRCPAAALTVRPDAVAELQRFATEQAVLRQVAILIARCVPLDEVIAAAASAATALLGADATHLVRFPASGGPAVIARDHRDRTTLGPNLPGSAGVAELVRVTGRPARMDSHAESRGSLPDPPGGPRRTASIGAPVTVDGRVWGALVVHWSASTPPAGAAGRLIELTGLLATAVDNAESRIRLHAACARIVLADDAVRRGFERDLHDGVQQRLVSLGLELRAVEALAGDDRRALKAGIGRTVEGLTRAFEDLQDICERLYPAILAQRGLTSALRTLARRSPMPVTVSARCEPRLGRGAETAAYHVVAEALARAAERARACAVRVDVDVTADARTGRSMLVLAICCDGTGGGHTVLRSTLGGLADRVELLGGQLRLAHLAPFGASLLLTLPADGRPTPVRFEPGPTGRRRVAGSRAGRRAGRGGTVRIAVRRPAPGGRRPGTDQAVSSSERRRGSVTVSP